MNIESLSQFGSINSEQNNNQSIAGKINSSQEIKSAPLTLSDIKYTIDEATGILQAIVVEKLSDEVIRKLPPDEYLQLLSLLNEMVSGFIDEKV
ncbi:MULTISPECIES: flagellar protein FlaG [unclassified Legionella]|uniref:flagellar protein FlaG n=1 Tax=unclassified Legionella TaxID=2622702 RepID=UPI00105563F9|nr:MULTISPECIES: flagellar protein FlaG [unclassified Legionella]MDI9818849.1 flagellar protein FlaG [Legionella sp. PL877]